MQKQPGYESDLFRLAIYERATGKSTVLTESFRNWVDEFRWSNDSKSIYFAGPVEGQNPHLSVSTSTQKQITQILADKTIDASEFDPSAGAFVLHQAFRRRAAGNLQRANRKCG